MAQKYWTLVVFHLTQILGCLILANIFRSCFAQCSCCVTAGHGHGTARHDCPPQPGATALQLRRSLAQGARLAGWHGRRGQGSGRCRLHATGSSRRCSTQQPHAAPSLLCRRLKNSLPAATVHKTFLERKKKRQPENKQNQLLTKVRFTSVVGRRSRHEHPNPRHKLGNSTCRAALCKSAGTSASLLATNPLAEPAGCPPSTPGHRFRDAGWPGYHEKQSWNKNLK